MPINFAYSTQINIFPTNEMLSPVKFRIIVPGNVNMQSNASPYDDPKLMEACDKVVAIMQRVRTHAWHFKKSRHPLKQSLKILVDELRRKDIDILMGVYLNNSNAYPSYICSLEGIMAYDSSEYDSNMYGIDALRDTQQLYSNTGYKLFYPQPKPIETNLKPIKEFDIPL